MEREDGFYWVKTPDFAEEVACWQEENWWICGDDRKYYDDDFDKIGERVQQIPCARRTVSAISPPL